MSSLDAAPSSFVPTHPFASHIGADVIPRSSDGAEFHVHRVILSLVSPVCETMFSLPQPNSSPAVPVIDLEENSATLDQALRFSYPAAHPTFKTLDELQEIIHILVSKYDMQSLVPRYLVSNRFGAYAIAFSHGWEDIGKVAAQECLKLPLRVLDNEVPAELKHLTSTAYYNLLRYHFQCSAVAKRTSEDLTWIQNSGHYCWFTCNSGQCLIDVRRSSTQSVRYWFVDFCTKMGDLLAVTPVMDLRNTPLFSDAISAAARCNGICRTHGFDSFSGFIGVWEKKIAQEIAKAGSPNKSSADLFPDNIFCVHSRGQEGSH
ncbi:hypothetical protein B0H19DRAFT_1298234 [Mycena capillaripes]|nr:hypothetical protein B0H19DRAFT_1298234 [Mycena capillaripes]